MLIRSKEEFIDPRIPGFTSVQVMGFIRDCVVYAKPKNSIEIGTFMGRSAYAICSALKSLGGERKLLCVDFYTQVLNNDFLKLMVTLKNGSVVVFDDNSDVFPGVKRLISEIQLTSELIYLGEEGVDIAFQVRNASMLKQQISEIYQLEKK